MKSFLISLILLFSLPQFLCSPSCGVHFCNFYPHDSPLLVYVGWDPIGPAYIVPYATCSYFDGAASPDLVVWLYLVLESTGEYQKFTSAPSGTTAKCDEFDSDNQNFIVARPSADSDLITLQHSLVVDSLLVNQAFDNPNLGPIWYGEMEIQEKGRIRHLLYNSAPAKPFSVFKQEMQQIKEWSYDGNLDCYNVGPPEFGSLTDFGDMAIGFGLRAVEFDSEETEEQWIQCAIANEEPDMDNLIGQPFQLITGSSGVPVNSVILNAIIGLGVEPFPYRTVSYIASARSRQNQVNAMRLAGQVEIYLTNTQSRICNLADQSNWWNL
jgi:hypothetical protein